MKWSTRKCVVLLAIAFLGVLCIIHFSPDDNFEEGEEDELRGLESGSARQMEYLWQIRAYPDAENIDYKFWAAWEHAQAMRGDILTNRNLPGNTGNASRVNY